MLIPNLLYQMKENEYKSAKPIGRALEEIANGDNMLPVYTLDPGVNLLSQRNIRVVNGYRDFYFLGLPIPTFE